MCSDFIYVLIRVLGCSFIGFLFYDKWGCKLMGVLKFVELSGLIDEFFIDGMMIF